MLPTLLWRCPLCKTNDALVHKTRWFRSDLVNCSACGTAWELIRVPGSDFRFRVIAGEKAGFERPLAEWYDMMKEDLQLVPLAEPSFSFEEGEALYLKSKDVQFRAFEHDPLFWPQEPKTAPTPAEGPSLPPLMKSAGIGQLFLTDRRLICQVNETTASLWLKSVRGVELITDRFFVLRCTHGVYFLSFLQESLLKWLTYVAHALRPIEEEHGGKVHLHHY